jgi:predicted enzyme related to lactoylglutathione lyase
MIRRLASIVLLTENWSHLVHFYRDILGLVQLYIDEEGGSAELVPPGGGTTVCIKRQSNPDEILERNGIVLSFHVEDIEATVAELQQRGVRFLHGIESDEEGTRFINFFDPECHRLHLFE